MMIILAGGDTTFHSHLSGMTPLPGVIFSWNMSYISRIIGMSGRFDIWGRILYPDTASAFAVFEAMSGAISRERGSRGSREAKCIVFMYSMYLLHSEEITWSPGSHSQMIGSRFPRCKFRSMPIDDRVL